MSWLDWLLGRDPEMSSQVRDAKETSDRADQTITDIQTTVDNYWVAKSDRAVLAEYNAEQQRIADRRLGPADRRNP